MEDKWNYFSVMYDLILVEKKLPYDIFINSSVVKGREKFVKVIAAGRVLHENEPEELYRKYFQLYIPENQRRQYLKSLVQSQADDVKKTDVIKESALQYLHNIFDKGKDFSTEYLSQNIEGCRDVVESMVDVLDSHNIESLRSLIANLSFHDFYTYDHSINVSMYCIAIYRAINPKAKRKELIHAGLGGLLHDLGKVKVPTNILNNPGGLSPEEYEIIKKHPDFGLDLLLQGHTKVDDSIDLKVITRVVHEHHENFDGTGYPRKLKGRDEIHLLARICTIADFFDAITTKRSYNEVLSIAEAMNTMRKFKSTKLDPDLFDIFDNHVRYVKADITRDLRLLDSFDPTIPYNKLPIEEIKKFQKEMDFGKVKVFVEKLKRK